MYSLSVSYFFLIRLYPLFQSLHSFFYKVLILKCFFIDRQDFKSWKHISHHFNSRDMLRVILRHNDSLKRIKWFNLLALIDFIKFNLFPLDIFKCFFKLGVQINISAQSSAVFQKTQNTGFFLNVSYCFVKHFCSLVKRFCCGYFFCSTFNYGAY